MKTWVEVSAGALRANAAALRRIIGARTKLLAVVKSNAYGHGLAATVRALKPSSIDWFGVDSIDEALALRQVDARRPVLILGYTLATRLSEAVRKGFSLTAYNPETVSRLAHVGTKRRPAKVHLKIETGTSRQGITLEDLPAFCRRLQRTPQLIVEGVSTHFANIEDTSDPSYALAQQKRFETGLQTLGAMGFRPELIHTAASAAALLYPATHFSMVRTGISLYGLWPSAGTQAVAAKTHRHLELQPALTWKTVVAQVKRLAKGTPVSYGLTERVRRDALVAVLPVGYGDGFDRGLSSVGSVLIRGQRAKVLGRVCMNMFMADVTDIPGIGLEDEAVLLGRQGRDQISAEEIAARLGTINYEVVTRISPLIERKLVA